MISSLSALEKAFPDKEMRDFYVMHNWKKRSKRNYVIDDDPPEFVRYIAPGKCSEISYLVQVQKVAEFEKKGIFINL